MGKCVDLVGWLLYQEAMITMQALKMEVDVDAWRDGMEVSEKVSYFGTI